jgi:hypothetical protein
LVGPEIERNMLGSYFFFRIALDKEQYNSKTMNKVNMRDIKEKGNSSKYLNKCERIT